MKKRYYTFVLSLLVALTAAAQGWPSQYRGVMLQGFYWDSFNDTQWTNLESQADELSEFFQLVWVPQSGKSAANPSMGYDDIYWFSDYTSSFGNEQQLRSMIKTFRSKGIGTIADVVINHRSSLDGKWMSFPEETYKGVTYRMLPSDICSNDDGGKTAAQAEVKPTGATDSGEDFDGARDLDHSSANVQTMVKAYLDFLLNDLGYAGFRYDMVRGYAPKYTSLYNVAAQPTYSVGEYWDGNASNLAAWVNGTKSGDVVQSAAFDFAMKYNLRDCCNAGTNWSQLSKSSLASDLRLRRYAVTFVDNHDTYNRGNDNETTANILAANAFILAAPGTPCIFLPHWKTYKQAIKQMIYARQLAGLHNESTYSNLVNKTSQYAMRVNGADGASVIVLMGDTSWPASATAADYFAVATGEHFAYYVSRNVESAWTDLPSGTYENAQTVTLHALSATSGARLVYTTDGTAPTASSAQVADGATITIGEGKTTLRVALLKDGKVSGEITRTYEVKAFTPYDITVYVNADKTGWSTLNFWAWDAAGNNLCTNKTWPGDRNTATVTLGGKTWHYADYHIKSVSDAVNFVFSTASGSPQTVDVVGITKTSFLEISSTMTSGKYQVDDVTSEYATGIADITSDADPYATAPTCVVAPDGRTLRSFPTHVSTGDALSGLPKGLYVVNGKKVVK